MKIFMKRSEILSGVGELREKIQALQKTDVQKDGGSGGLCIENDDGTCSALEETDAPELFEELDKTTEHRERAR